MPQAGYYLWYVGSILAKYATVIKVAMVVASVAYTVRTSQIAKQRAKRAARDAQGITQMVRDSVAPVANIYGERRVSGPIILANETGTDRKFLHLVIALAPHEVFEIKAVYFDDVQVPYDGITGEVINGPFVGKAKVWVRTGSAGQSAFENLLIECPGFWDVNSKLEGCAAVYVRLEYDQQVFTTGIPNVSALVRGKKLYDPRTGSSAWSANPALIAADILTDTYIGAGIPWASIDTAELIASANICDESVPFVAPAPTDNTGRRYSCHYYLDSSAGLEEHLSAAVDSMAGAITRSSGKWFIRAGAYRTPTITFTDSDLMSAPKVTPRKPKRALCNRVKGSFIDIAGGYVAAEFPAVTNALYLSQDNGEEIWRDLDLVATVDPVQAQRLAKIELERTRQQCTVSMSVGLRGLQVMPSDTVMLTLPRMGWTNKVFEVTNWTLRMDSDGKENQSIVVDMELQETAPSVYSWSLEETTKDPSPDTDLPDPWTVLAPTGLTATQEGALSPNGDWQNGARLNWTAPADGYVTAGGYIQIRYKKVTDSIWTEAATIDGNMTTYFLASLLVGVAYNIEIRSENQLRAQSSWVAASPLTLVADTTAPGIPTGVSLSTVSGRQISLVWANPPDKDLSTVEIYRNTVNDWTTSSYVAATRGARFSDSSVVPGTTYFYWTRALDYTGNGSAFSAPVSATAPALVVTDVDNTVPAAPTSVFSASSTGVYIGAGGTAQAWAQFIIPSGGAPAAARASQVLYRRYPDGGDEWAIAAEVPIRGGAVRLEGLQPGGSYAIQRRFVSFSGVLGALVTTTPVHIAGLDDVAPAAPTGISTSISELPYIKAPSESRPQRAMRVKWAANTEADLSHYELKMTGTDSDAATDIFMFGEDFKNPSIAPKTRTDWVMFDLNWESIPGYIPQGFIRIRAVDLFGNASAWVYVGKVRDYSVFPAGDMSAQNSSAVTVSGVSTGATGASSVRKVLCRYQTSETLNFYAPGGSPYAICDLDISNRGFSTRPDVGGVHTHVANGYIVSYEPAASSSTAARMVIYNTTGNFSASFFYQAITAELIEYD